MVCRESRQQGHGVARHETRAGASFSPSALDLGGGRILDPLAPHGFGFSPMDVAGPLSRICRWGGRCKHFYSVGQHSVWVAVQVQRRNPELAMHALLHDAAEAFLGDIPTPLKRLLYVRCPRANELIDFADAEAQLLSAILVAFGLREIEPHEEAVIAAADRLALAVEARDLMGDPAWARVPDLEEPSLVCGDPYAAVHAWLQMFRRLEAKGVGR